MNMNSFVGQHTQTWACIGIISKFRWVIVCTGFVLLAACDGDETLAEQTDRQGSLSIPAEKEFPMRPDAARPGDKIARRGAFRISPETRFCTVGFVSEQLDAMLESLVAPGLPRIMRTVGWPDSEILRSRDLDFSTPELGGQGRVIPVDSADLKRIIWWKESCPNNGVNILLTQNFEMNNKGQPYKVTLTARQGVVFWESSIERPEYGGLKLVVPGQYKYEQGAEWDPSSDLKRLQKNLERVMFEGGEQ